MIVEVIASFKSGSSREHLETELKEDESIPTIVRTDPSMLRQVISNLLTNAIEHSKENPVCIRRKHRHFYYVYLLVAFHNLAVPEETVLENHFLAFGSIEHQN